MGPLELYEKLTEQGNQVRVLKTAKAGKVSFKHVFCYEKNKSNTRIIKGNPLVITL